MTIGSEYIRACFLHSNILMIIVVSKSTTIVKRVKIGRIIQTRLYFYEMHFIIYEKIVIKKEFSL